MLMSSEVSGSCSCWLSIYSPSFDAVDSLLLFITIRTAISVLQALQSGNNKLITLKKSSPVRRVHMVHTVQWLRHLSVSEAGRVFPLLLALLLTAATGLATSAVLAQEGGLSENDAPQYVNGVYQGDEIDVELIAESQHAVPGETLWTAIRLDPTEGWHTYSKWPGDSGDATYIHSWNLPEGAQAGEIHWPVPTWLPFPGSDLVTFSYKKEVFLMVPVEVPADFQGTDFAMTAHVEWQVCDLICLIEDAEVSLTLPVVQDGASAANAQWADAFAATRASWPVQDHALESQFAVAGDRISFSFASNDDVFADAEEVWFFPAQRRILDPGPLRDVTLYPGVAQITHGQPRRMLQDLEQVNGLLAVQGTAGEVTG
jgi:thiol:disulfide interchange protein DsbD